MKKVSSSKKQMSTVKKIILTMAALITLFILFIIGTIVSKPFFDNLDKNRFETLDKQSRTIYDAVKAKSGGVETWTYEAKCNPERSGWMLTGQFFCETSLTTEVNVTNVTQLIALHEKYYPIIDDSSYLKQKTELNKQHPGQFGVNFVVSSAEKKYNGTNTGSAVCTYLTELIQPKEDNSTIYNQSYGADIATGTGRAIISLRCADMARGDWYGSVTTY
jgi:hypothetical protein